MRWLQNDYRSEPAVIGNKRTVYRFLFLPKRLNGEWRWLETASIEQEFQEWTAGIERPVDVCGWRNIRWGKDYGSISEFLADHPFEKPPRPAAKPQLDLPQNKLRGENGRVYT